MNARLFAFLFACLLAGSPAFAAPAGQQAEPDLSNAVPAREAGKLPRSEQRYRTLQQQIQRTKPDLDTAKQKSDAVAAQAAQLRQQLIATVARVQALEQDKSRIDSGIATLKHREGELSDQFARERAQVSHLLAVVERLQLDMPPAIALRPADALSSARGAMVLGASLPRVYGSAARLSHQLKTLAQTRAELLRRREESIRNAAKLSAAREQLDQLVATKVREATGAHEVYATLQKKFDVIAGQASDLKSLLDRVAALRPAAASSRRGVIAAAGKPEVLPRELVRPVIGPVLEVSADRAPGLTYAAAPSAAVVAPSDSRVLFAGPYHKAGQILILEAAADYDVVLAGLDRVYVQPGDQLLAGEPVGRMPAGKNRAELYFEMRHNGKGMSPAPWLGIARGKAKKS